MATTTEETRAQYRNRARLLKEQLSRRTACPVEKISPMALVEDLLSKKEVAVHDFDALAGGIAIAFESAQSPVMQGSLQDDEPRRTAYISKSTFRMYKASLRQNFSEAIENAKTALEVQNLEEAMAVLNSASQIGYSKRGHFGSALKSNKFSERDFRTVMEALDDRIGTLMHANAVRAFLNANRLVGLRPVEWEHASVCALPGSDRLVLQVKNAKTTNGRGNGETRTLLLDDLAPEEVDYLHEMVQLIEAVERGLYLNGRGQVTTVKKWMACLSETLRVVTRSIFPHRKSLPTFYSLRHQVAADAKKGGANRAEVAALMGHGSDATASTHYARRVSGNREQRVTASPENVKTVKAKAKSRVKEDSPQPGM